HIRRAGEVRIIGYVPCSTCGEQASCSRSLIQGTALTRRATQVRTYSDLPSARCRHPEGCGHMFCRVCLVDYLPVMREGNHQHRNECRFYEPFNRVDIPPGYAMPFVQEHHGRPVQVTYHHVPLSPRSLSMEDKEIPKPVSQVKVWFKRIFLTLFVWCMLGFLAEYAGWIEVPN
ncbi:unnamed protein product, partial [Rhizoctonia solani]